MLSRHTKILKLDSDNYAIFNNLMMNIIIVNKNEKNKIINGENISKKEREMLVSSGIYINDKKKDDLAENKIKEIYESSCGVVEVLYLILTNNCNLRCSYCFLENNSNCPVKRENMSIDTAICALKKYELHLKKHNVKEGTLLLYGGEPLLNMKLIKNIVEFCNNSSVNFNINLITNGILLSDNVIKYLKNNNVKISISIDGPKNVTNKHRKYRGTDIGVYDDVIKSIKLLQENNVTFGLSLVITDYFLKNMNEVLKWIKDNHTGPIFYNLFHFDKPTDKLIDFSDKSADFIINSYSYFLENGNSIYDTRIQRQINSYINNEFVFSDCAAIGLKQLTILPNGNVCICHGDSSNKEHYIDNINNLDFENLRNVKNYDFWKKRATIYNKKCLNCEALFICGGGCPHHAESVTGNRNNIDKSYCRYAKKILRWMIKNNVINDSNSIKEVNNEKVKH